MLLALPVAVITALHLSKTNKIMRLQLLILLNLLLLLKTITLKINLLKLNLLRRMMKFLGIKKKIKIMLKNQNKKITQLNPSPQKKLIKQKNLPLKIRNRIKRISLILIKKMLKLLMEATMKKVKKKPNLKYLKTIRKISL